MISPAKCRHRNTAINGPPTCYLPGVPCRAQAVVATWGNCGRLLSGGVKSERIGLGIGKKESSHGAVCWPRRIARGDEPLRGGSNGHDPVARQVCIDT